MPVRQFGRRHFLVGTGATLSIPFLSSLLPRTARAQAPDNRFFVAFMTMHGGVWGENMYPGDSVLNQSYALYGDHNIRYGRLSAGSSFSPVLSSGSLPQSLVDKMMILRGMDIPFYLGHNTGGPLGNYERRDQGNDESLYVPTIDQVLANWNGFYGSGDPYLMRSMHVGSDMSWVQRSGFVEAVAPVSSPAVLFQTLLSGARPYTPPTTAPTPTQPTPTSPTPTSPTPTSPTPTSPTPTSPMPTSPTPTSPMPTSPSTPMPTPTTPTPMPQAFEGESRTHVLNRVVEHYNQLVKGGFGDARRLSANDKSRLTDHMDLVNDLAKRFDAQQPVGMASMALSTGGAACNPQAANSGNNMDWGQLYGARPYGDLRKWHQDYNSVFAAAISCGASRIATVRAQNTFHPSSSYWIDWEQWHQPVAHRSDFSRSRWASEGTGGTHPQDIVVTAKNNFYKDVFVDLIKKLDGIDGGNGVSVLDQGLVMWSQESGTVTHSADSLPVVTAGSANGYFNTGHYFDLRNRAAQRLKQADSSNNDLNSQRLPGILYNQWLSNVLQSMGMSPSQFNRSHPLGWAGYGHARNGESSTAYPSRVFNDANKKIPKVTRGT